MGNRKVVTCFLEHRGRILLLRRSEMVSVHQGKWACVSGSIEGPSPLDQAYVEIAEETGLAAGDVELVRSGEPLRVTDESLGMSWLVHPFRFRVDDPHLIRLDWEHSDSCWIEPEEMADFDTVPRLKETWERLRCPQRSPEE